MQRKPCLTTGRRATARCIMKGTGLETDGMMAWANQPLQPASMVMYSGAVLQSSSYPLKIVFPVCLSANSRRCSMQSLRRDATSSASCPANIRVAAHEPESRLPPTSASSAPQKPFTGSRGPNCPMMCSPRKCSPPSFQRTCSYRAKRGAPRPDPGA